MVENGGDSKAENEDEEAVKPSGEEKEEEEENKEEEEENKEKEIMEEKTDEVEEKVDETKPTEETEAMEETPAEEKQEEQSTEEKMEESNDDKTGDQPSESKEEESGDKAEFSEEKMEQDKEAAAPKEAKEKEEAVEYKPIQQACSSHKERASRRPSSRSSCEVIVLIGLPCSGKTTWAQKFCRDQGDKSYEILGPDMILDKMGLGRVGWKENYETLLKQANEIVNNLLILASEGKRNVIIDQVRIRQLCVTYTEPETMKSLRYDLINIVC